MVSRRYIASLFLLLVVVLWPTVRHGYLGHLVAAAKVSDATLPFSVAGATSAPRTRTGGWMAGAYAADSWVERVYDQPGRSPVSLFVARGFDLKKLYHHPELGVLRGRSFAPLRESSIDGEPVHILANTTDGESAVYALIYEGRWIGNPYVLQLSSALTSLWTGRRPITLVFAYGNDVLERGQPTPFVVELLRTSVRQLSPAAAGRS